MPRNRMCSCKYCDEGGLIWGRLNQQWRLFDPRTNEVHDCRMVMQEDFFSIMANRNEAQALVLVIEEMLPKIKPGAKAALYLTRLSVRLDEWLTKENNDGIQSTAG